MKLIKEHINFERGLDPKDAMSIGMNNAELLFNKIYTIAKKKYNVSQLCHRKVDNWSWTLRTYFTIEYNDKCYEIDLYDNEIIKGYEIGVGKDVSYAHIITSLRTFKQFVEGYEHTNESINFERGLDPKKSMGTGRYGIEAIIKLNPTPATGIADKFILNKADIYVLFLNYQNAQIDIAVGRKHKLFDWPKLPLPDGYFNLETAAQMWAKFEKIAWDMGAGVIKDSKGNLHPIEINETQNFNRGLDPKEAMNVGMLPKLKKTMEEYKWSFWENEPDHQLDWAIRCQRYEFIPLIIKMGAHFDEVTHKYFYESDPTYGVFSHDNPAVRIESKKKAATRKDLVELGYLKESQHFKRGLDPKDAMTVGDVQKRKNEADRAKLIEAIEDMNSKFGAPNDKIVIERDDIHQFNISFNSIKNNTYEAELYFNTAERKPHTARFIDANDHIEPKWCATVEDVITKLEILIIQHEG